MIKRKRKGRKMRERKRKTNIVGVQEGKKKEKKMKV